MHDLVKPGIAVAAIAALGIGCYTWGQHRAADPTLPSPYPGQRTTMTTMPAANPVAATTSTTVVTPASAVQPNTLNSASLADPQTTSVRSAPGIQAMSKTTSTTNTTSSAPLTPITTGAPVAAVPYGGTTVVNPSASSSQTTYVEKKTVETTTPRHVAYTSHTVHYKHHKTDKVHIARGAKHGVMFALKLPGRAAF